MSAYEFAKRELEIIENSCDGESEKELQRHINENILEVIKVLEKQGHSGMSIAYVKDIICDLIDYKPLTKLTGEDWEWKESFDEVKQNIRCPSVFMENGVARYNNAYVFKEPCNDLYFHCNESSKKIEFPCSVDKLSTKRIKLWFKTKFVPIKWAMRLHLYTEDK